MAYRILINNSVRRAPIRLSRVFLSQAVESPLEQSNSKQSFRDKVRDTWNGPTFKYWFIGGTAFVSWLSYYSWKAYKKKCIHVELLPALPNHPLLERKQEIDELWKLWENQGSLFNKHNVKKVLVKGPSASGKTTLVKQFVDNIQSLQSTRVGLPVSTVTAFLSCDSEMSFLLSLKALAAKLEINSSDLDEVIRDGKTFNNSSFTEQCNALIENIQDKLIKHPGWIFVFDQLQSTTPNTVIDSIKTCLEGGELWSSGTVVMVGDGIKEKMFEITTDQVYAMKRGLSKDDSVALLRKIINVDGEVGSLNRLADLCFSNPLALLCTGVLMKKKLSLKEARSIDDIVSETCQDIEHNVKQVLQDNHHMTAFTSTISGLKLVTVETLVAMVLKDVMNKDPYLKHGIDFLASVAPGTQVPQSVITRHLSSSFYKLQSLAKPPNLLDFMSKQKRDAEEVMTHADEYDPKGKAWSNKNLAHYMRKIEDFFQTTYKTVKDIYFLVYGELPELPEGDDGMGMFSNCQLVSSSKVEPGGVKTFNLHPLVYNAARQHLLSSTALQLERKHIAESKHFHETKSWYRKMSSFNEQASLQTFRNSAGLPSINKNISEEDASKLLFRYNLGIDVSSIFKDTIVANEEQFWHPNNMHLLGHLQDHVSRVVGSICEQLNIAKGDVNGHTSKKLLLHHLEYLLKNQPYEITGHKNQIKGLFTLAKGYSSVYKDSEASKQLLDQVVAMQNANADTEPMEIAQSLAEKAQYFIDQDDYESAKPLLLEACDIYESQRRKLGEYKDPIRYGKVLGTLGAVYGSLGMKIESKETIERALMMQQSVPPDMSDEEKSKKFGTDFASTLIDLGHAYVSLGLPLYGKKILDLALTAQKNLNGENHPEVVRAMTVLAIAHLMQGHNEESKKLRKEAGKIQSAINKIPLY